MYINVHEGSQPWLRISQLHRSSGWAPLFLRELQLGRGLRLKKNHQIYRAMQQVWSMCVGNVVSDLMHYCS